MPYYIRVLGKESVDLSVEELRESAKPAEIEVEAQSGKGQWTQLLLKHVDGSEIAVIERNDVIKGQLGADELSEFLEEIEDYKPVSAVAWLRQYLPTVKVIYAFQLLSGTNVDDGWNRMHSVYSNIWNRVGGILQANGEGFSDEDGFTILLQFSDNASGSWNMGLLGQDGRFVHFEMDLGNKHHREAFERGELPKSVKRL